MRIVSLACSNTEIVCALGCADLLVGVDDHSDHPEDVVGRLPRVGPDLDIDVERVAALEPDLVLATLTVPGHERVVERLERAGLPFVAPEPVSLEDVYRDVRDVATLLGVPARGDALVAEMRTELGGGASRDGGPENGGSEDRGSDEGWSGDSGPSDGWSGDDAPSILVQWWPKPVITPGRLSWASDVLRAAGARPLLGHEEHKSRPMTDEEVAERRPDAVVLSWCGVDPRKYRPDVVLRNETWAELPFVRESRVYCVGEPFLGRPGPRLVEGVRAVRRIVEELRP